MFKDAFEGGTILRFREEFPAEDGMSCLVMFGVTDTKLWGQMLSDFVVTLDDGEEYGAELRKTYYVDLEEGTGKKNVRFLWCVYVWADTQEGIDEAFQDLKPFFSRAVRKPQPAPARGADPRIQERRRSIVHKTIDSQGNEVGVVALPHAPKNRNDIPADQRVTGLHDKRRTRARAEAWGGGETSMPDRPDKL